MKKLDYFTPIGIFVGLTMILFAIFFNAGPGNFHFFVQWTSIVIVLGGLSAAILINFSKQELALLPKVFKEVFHSKDYDLQNLITTFKSLSTKARREGLLALEMGLEEVEDPFIEKGVLLAVDGIEQETIKDILMAEVVAMEERHRKGRYIIEKAGEYAPAWGMIGTLVGLVLMLQNLNDPATLGPNMAIALLTTLYGTLLANLVFLPMANKLENKTEEEVFIKQIIIEGILGVQSGQNPKVLEEKLGAFLPARIKEKEAEAREGEAAYDQA
ncbi:MULTISPECIES: flagellar motor protein MotP [Alteribacter]|uniref:Flagellar motor protein MotP n=1 Tax=Alteribacter keqinensis TaxID=2483800 RepID=A0A3M7TY07_9BACI|nr:MULTISPECIES: flagellar motor protein MotP [Alteribacter]MBM7096410.1 flagellar motor protein MotP [Alteribacter salitolerans]RNA70373.1 flagellar motor protein MotP [Alteribacter keqinensis]